MIRNIIGVTRNLIQKIEFQIKMKYMDDTWYYKGRINISTWYPIGFLTVFL